MLPRAHLWLLLVGAPACGGLGLQDVTDSGRPEAVRIDGLDPTEGPAGHQTPVVVSGAGFTEAAEVWFGDEPAAVTLVDEATLLAVAPAQDAGAVDVRVRVGASEATLGDAYTYVADSGDSGDSGGDSGDSGGDSGDSGGDSGDSGGDSGDSGGDSGDSGGDSGDSAAGLVGGLLELSLVQVACPDCLGYDATIQVSGDMGFHAPTAASWLAWLPPSGSCVDDPARTAPASTFLDAGPWAYLTTSSVSIGMRQSGGIYAASGLAATDFARSAAYDLSLPDGGADLAAFSVAGAFTTPGTISSIDPVELLYTTPRDAFSARIRASAATFQWSPSGGADPFLVLVDVYDPRGAFQHEIVCLGPDDGALTVPTTLFAGDANDSLLVVGMFRYALGSFRRPDDGSTVETVASFGVLGTGILGP